MLVLSRKVGQEILIGENISIVVNKIAGDRVSIAIKAPEQVRILRGELKSFKETDSDLAQKVLPLERFTSPMPATAAG